MSNWVRFADIKAGVRLGALLRWYGVRLERSGADQYRGRCPIHKGQGREAFHANLARDMFHCFACGAGGNVLDFVAAMEQCSVREAALRLQERYGSATTGAAFSNSTGPPVVNRTVTGYEKKNRPLSFSLTVNGSHPYLARRGIERATAAYFGVGYYCGPGLMQGRIAIPIHDPDGRLVAYAGRAVDSGGARYRFPAGFQKSQVLFNYHRARHTNTDSVIAVEGFFGCMRVHQAGFPNVIGLMGAVLSPGQRELLRSFDRIILLLDGDETGWTAAKRISAALGQHWAVMDIRLEPGWQPDQMSADLIRSLLTRAETVGRALETTDLASFSRWSQADSGNLKRQNRGETFTQSA